MSSDASGDVNTAKTQLLEAGRTTGSPQLNSFGPKWDLANELLGRGERETVLQYLDLCSKFWKEGDSDKPRKELAFWAEEIRRGKTPELGAFVYLPN